MKKKGVLLILVLSIIIPTTYFADNLDNVIVDKATPEEIELVHNENIKKEIERLIELDNKKNNFQSNILRNDPNDYKTVLGPKKTVDISGYPGNQPPKETKFPNGGSLFYVDSGGPTLSTSVSFPSPYNMISISAQMGNAGSSGASVKVPDKVSYWKLYVTKEYEVQPFIIYKKYYNYNNGRFEWKEWSRSFSKVWKSNIVGIRKV